jgi:hypothetical protein
MAQLRARAADLAHVHAFTRGLELDIQAATAALTLPFHSGRTEGVNTKTKMIKRQCSAGQGSPSSATASCSANAPLPSEVRQSRKLRPARVLRYAPHRLRLDAEMVW